MTSQPVVKQPDILGIEKMPVKSFGIASGL